MTQLKGLLFLLFFLVMSACSQKPGTSTQFSILKLSANTLATAADVSGGIFLYGKSPNNSFSAGLAPSQVAGFNIDLPAEDWEFFAIAWQGTQMLTGTTLCAYASTKIGGTSVRVNMTLSNSNCQNPKISSASAINATVPQNFKSLTINSCLNPLGKDPNVICDGSDFATLNNIPGESLSVLLKLEGSSTFGPAPSSLQTDCYNTVGLINPTQLSQGLIETNINLPIGGVKLPITVKGYEKFHCPANELHGEYKFPDGLDGSSGTFRQLDLGSDTNYLFTIADNIVGVVGSPFLTSHFGGSGPILPLASCNDTCYNTTDNSPNAGNANEHVRDNVWSFFGSPTRQNSYDYDYTLTPGVPFDVVNNDSEFFTVQPNSTEQLVFSISEGGASEGGSCTGNQLHLYWKNGESTVDSLVALASTVVNDQCFGLFTISGSGTTMSTWTDLTQTIYPDATPGAYIPRRREEGEFNSVSYTLIGPIGAMLTKSGYSTIASICSGNVSTTANLPDGTAVSIQITTPTSSAVLPDFDSAPVITNTIFERKLSLRFDGQIEEAFYFNCTNDRSVGAYLDKEIDGDYTSITQLQWNVTDSNSQWFEGVSYYQDISVSESWRQYLAANITPTEQLFWGMQGSALIELPPRYSAKISGTTLYYNDGRSDDMADSFQQVADDLLYTVSTNSYNGTAPTVLIDRGLINNSLLVDPNLFNFFDMDITAPDGVWDLNF